MTLDIGDTAPDVSLVAALVVVAVGRRRHKLMSILLIGCAVLLAAGFAELMLWCYLTGRPPCIFNVD